MKKMAIDVVLLPPYEISQKAIQLNQELVKKYSGDIRLDEIDCVPHISLCMGCIDISHWGEIQLLITDIAKTTGPFTLSTRDISPYTAPNGEIISGIDFKKNNDLVVCEQEIMEILWKYLSYDVDTSMLYNPDEVNEMSLYWIQQYQFKHGHPEKFEPHITLGIGKVENPNLEITFQAGEIAIFQLGNYCTCRKKLHF